jgi:large subunit ribosomal protein L3
MNLCMKKIGMSQMKYQSSVIGVTFLWAQKLKVLGHKTLEKDGYEAMIIGAGEGKLSSWNKAQHYLFADYDEKKAPQELYEFRTSNLLPVGTEIKPEEVFSVGSYVDVAGTSKGRGFTGVMKRHNFCGLPATHGVSRAHRKPGSTGQRTHPGRVFKGKKMPGHYGNERITVQSMKVVFSEAKELLGISGSVIGVHGAVPGPNNGFCYLQHAVKRGETK